eukprot:SAG22_NODE_2215_length_2825_cov_20.860465_2_plen_301_part_00
MTSPPQARRGELPSLTGPIKQDFRVDAAFRAAPFAGVAGKDPLWFQWTMKFGMRQCAFSPRQLERSSGPGLLRPEPAAVHAASPCRGSLPFALSGAQALFTAGRRLLALFESGARTADWLHRASRRCFPSENRTHVNSTSCRNGFGRFCRGSHPRHPGRPRGSKLTKLLSVDDAGWGLLTSAAAALASHTCAPWCLPLALLCRLDQGSGQRHVRRGQWVSQRCRPDPGRRSGPVGVHRTGLDGPRRARADRGARAEIGPRVCKTPRKRRICQRAPPDRARKQARVADGRSVVGQWEVFLG